MADATHNIKAYFTVEGTNTATAKVHSFNNALARSGQVSMKTTGRLAGLNKGMGGLALRFVGYNLILNQVMGAQQKLLGWISESITKFREFEKNMAEVNTILTGTAQNALPRLQAGVENLSVTFGKSANDLAKGLYQILSAAVDSTEAINFLTIATKASVAGLSSVETAVDVLTSVVNSYGKSVEQAALVSDVLFQTVIRGKLRFEDLASALGYITPIAAAAGVAFEEVAAALSTVTRMGLHVDMASRGLALAIQNVVSPTKQASAAAQKYEIDMSALAVQVKGLTGFVTELSAASQEYGSKIIPEIIRNMRSLRVIMALTSEEGIAGFATDLNLVEKSAGRTEEALSKMMNIAQVQADILSQSMEALERNIGKAWHNVDIWFKKTQLWWGTFLSGGDANAAVQQFEDRVFEIRANAIKMLEVTTDLKRGIVDFSKVKEFLTLSKESASLNEDAAGIQKTVLKVEQMLAETKRNWKKHPTGGLFLEPEEVQAEVNRINVMLKELGAKEISLEGEYPYLTTVYNQVEASIANLTSTEKIATDALTDNEEKILALSPVYNKFVGEIDAASEEIQNHQRNILSLSTAMDDLVLQVERVYTSLADTEHVGRLDYKIDIAVEEVHLDRLKHFTDMITKYGENFEIEFYKIFSDDTTGIIKEYDENLKGVTDTVASFEAAQKKLKITMDESSESIRRNQIAIMELQLRGMIRRRGLTRSEERAIKKLQISNAKARLAQMKAQRDAEDEVTKSKYEEAKNELTKYFDFARHNLWLMKDVRDDEIEDLRKHYDSQGKLLTKYKGWYTDEHNELIAATNTYIEKMGEIASRPELDALFKEVFGVDAIAESRKMYIDYGKFVADNPIGSFTSYTPKQLEEIAARPGFEAVIQKRMLRDAPKVIEPTYSAQELAMEAARPGYLDIVDKRRLRNYHTGIDYVPETGPAMLDRGEKVISAENNRAGSGGVIIENLTIDVRQIADVDDIEKLGALLSVAQGSRVLNKSGKTRYRRA